MYRKTWLEIDLDSIKHNIKTIQQISNKNIIAVLKANAYGCGDVEVSKACIEAGAKMIAVSNIEEAIHLRLFHKNIPILIVGPIDDKDIPIIIDNDISISMYSLAFLKDIQDKDCTGLKVHLKIDTGMNRIGLDNIEDLTYAKNELLKMHCNIEGVFTHFSCADTDIDFTKKQYELFEELVDQLDYDFKWIHCSNSDASVFFDTPITNACRIGISLYGISTYCQDLKPVISMYTTIAQVKKVNKGEVIGYGATYQADEDIIVATLPIGYADGFTRDNQGRYVYIGDLPVQVIGRVCMDQCMVKLSDYFDPGTIIEIFGPHMPIENMAEELKTIPHEIMSLITPRVTRLYKENNQIIKEVNERL